MRNTFRRIPRSIASIALVMTLVSCDKSSPRPGTTITGPAPRPPSTPAVIRVEIASPPTVDPGASVQVRATAVKSDGSAEDVTDRMHWRTTNPRVLTISAAGVITARDRGESLVTGSYQGRTVSTAVMVLPTGTFRLTGRVTDEGAPLGNATVQVIEGTGEGLTATTAEDSGAFALYGLAGHVRIDLEREGYQNRTVDLVVTEHRAADFDLPYAGERPNLRGSYRLTVTTGSCIGGAGVDIPASRSYDAEVEQDVMRLTVRLGGASFVVNQGRGDHFRGTIFDRTVTFTIGDPYYEYYYYYYYYYNVFDVVERLSPTQALIIHGTVKAEHNASGISGTLDGMVALSPRATLPFVPFTSACSARNHRFELRRR